MKPTSTRRTFIRSSSLALGGILASPHAAFSIHHRHSMVGEIVGHGDFRYRVDKNWGIQDPGNIPVRNCQEMIEDQTGRIFLTTNHLKNNVIIYDKNGVVLETWGNEFPGIHGLSIFQEGSREVLFFTDTERNQVFKTTLDGKILLEINWPQESGVYTEKAQFLPTEVAITEEGDFFVADGYGENYVLHYDADGKYLGHFGGKGTRPDQFNCCHGLTIDYRDKTNPTLLVTSRTSQEFKRFTLKGEYLETIKVPGCWICRPVIHGEYLYFAVLGTRSWWEYDGLLVILDKENKIVSAPGARETDWSNGSLMDIVYDGKTFMNPHDVCVDRDENLYVAQWFSGNTYPVKLERI